MASLEETLVARLIAEVLSVGGRVYPLELPQAPEYPALVYGRVSADRLDGMTVDHGIAMPRIQVDVWAVTYLEILTVADQVRAALLRWQDTASTPEILDCFLENEIDLPADAVRNAEREPYRRMMDFRPWYREEYP